MDMALPFKEQFYPPNNEGASPKTWAKPREVMCQSQLKNYPAWTAASTPSGLSKCRKHPSIGHSAPNHATPNSMRMS